MTAAHDAATEQRTADYVLVTGASSGIGRATTMRLASQGYTVFAGVRDAADGADLVAQADGTVVPVELDVTRSDQIAAAAAHIGAAVRDAGLVGVINNAGEGFPGPMEAVSVDDLRAQLEVNVIGQVAVTQVFLPLIRRGHGRIVFVGSIGGKLAVEFAGPYHASKYAMEAIADSLRQELAPEKIRVVLIEPGATSTDIWDKAVDRVDDLVKSPSAARYRERLIDFRETLRSADRRGISAEQVAAAIEKSLADDDPATRYPVGLSAKVAYRLKPFVPDTVFDRLVRLAGSR